MKNQLDPLSLRRGKGFKLRNGITILNPTLGEIENIGYDDYQYYVHLLTCSVLDYADILWVENKLWYEDIKNDWKFFLGNCISKKEMKICYIENTNEIGESIVVSSEYRDALNFFLQLNGEYVISILTIDGNQQSILMYGEIENDICVVKKDCVKITEDYYFKMCEFIKKCNWVTSNYMFLKGGNKKAKKYILENDYKNRKVKRKKYIDLNSIISFLIANSSYGLKIYDFSIYLIYDLYYRNIKIDQYKNIQSRFSSGMIDTNKHPINWDKIDWAAIIE